MLHTGSRGFGWNIAKHFFVDGAARLGLGRSAARTTSGSTPTRDVGRRTGTSTTWRRTSRSRTGCSSARRCATRSRRSSAATAEIYYEISHNLIQKESGRFVARKGATRAFPEGHPALQGTPWEKTGHPILIPGSMETGSAILFAEPRREKSHLLGEPRRGAAAVAGARRSASWTRRRPTRGWTARGHPAQHPPDADRRVGALLQEPRRRARDRSSWPGSRRWPSGCARSPASRATTEGSRAALPCRELSFSPGRSKLPPCALPSSPCPCCSPSRSPPASTRARTPSGLPPPRPSRRPGLPRPSRPPRRRLRRRPRPPRPTAAWPGRAAPTRTAARGKVCETCGNAPSECVGGCHRDDQCAKGERCNQVQCIRCPCPGQCEAI